jgi:hypothetical protein
LLAYLTFPGIFPSATNKKFCYFMLAFTTVWAFAAFFLALFQCRYVTRH